MTTKTLVEQVGELAKKVYPGAQTRLQADPQGRVYGTIVSGSFDGIDEGKRQEELYRHVEAELGPESVRQVLFIFTNTPEEDSLFERDPARQAG